MDYQDKIADIETKMLFAIDLINKAAHNLSEVKDFLNNPRELKRTVCLEDIEGGYVEQKESEK